MHMAATREPHFSSSLPSPETFGGVRGPVKAAIEIKHKASTSEQLNGPIISSGCFGLALKP